MFSRVDCDWPNGAWTKNILPRVSHFSALVTTVPNSTEVHIGMVDQSLAHEGDIRKGLTVETTGTVTAEI